MSQIQTAKSNGNGKNKMAKAAKNTKATVVQKTDYRVCKEAMENPKVFAELARWAAKKLKLLKKKCQV